MPFDELKPKLDDWCSRHGASVKQIGNTLEIVLAAPKKNAFIDVYPQTETTFVVQKGMRLGDDYDATTRFDANSVIRGPRFVRSASDLISTLDLLV
jgi:hypothetical protein